MPNEQPAAPDRRVPASVDETVGIVELALRGFLDHLPLIVAALAVVLIAYLIGRLLRWVVRRALRAQDPTLARMLGTLASGVAVTLGAFVAMWIVFPTVNFREILASLGVTGLILGFALKDLIENFVAGMLILWRRPFHVADQVRSAGYEGTVEEINFRSTVLKTYDGVKVYIPNGKVFTEPLENLTGYRARRIEIRLGIDQRVLVARARELVLETVRSVEGVLVDPPPVVFFEDVGEFANNLRVLVWTEPPNRMSELTTRSDVTERLYEALTAGGVSFPYPIRTIQLQSVPPTAADDGRGSTSAPSSENESRNSSAVSVRGSSTRQTA